MKIISKFHDYYDSVQSEGMDKRLIFKRVTEKHQFSKSSRSIKANPLPWLNPFFEFVIKECPGSITRIFMKDKGYIDWIVPGVIVFAGKFYPYAHACIRDDATSSRQATLHSIEELEELLSTTDFKLEKLKKSSGIFESKTSWFEFFKQKGSDRWLNLMSMHSTPIILWQGTESSWSVTHELIMNPPLTEKSFYRVLDAWQAFQELSMFLGGLAAPERETTQISDKDRITQHGFDEWSFKKMPKNKK